MSPRWIGKCSKPKWWKRKIGLGKYRVQFVSSAAKEFRSLPLDLKRRMARATESLGDTPRPAGVRKLQGHERLYRIRVGQYRLIYEIDDHNRVIRVTQIRHRRDAYR
ncbi:MAG: type II toxin-antitoxin system RelE family toxin [Desulfobaccales bacterium]